MLEDDVIHFIPSGLIIKGWVIKERLLPILAATRGFWCWVATGQARVLEKTSMTGRFLAVLSLGKSNFVSIKAFTSPVNLAKSWFFLSGSEPAPIIYHPTISFSSLSAGGLLKLLMRVVLPNYFLLELPSSLSIFVSFVRLLPFLSSLGVYCSRDWGFYLETCS